MKTFASAVAIAAVATARDMPAGINPEMDARHWDRVMERNFYMRNIWTGVFQGIYGMTSSVDRPTEDCFGDWIPEKMQEVSDYKYNLRNDFWIVDMDMSATAAYDLVDLIFLNDQYCHFRSTFYDLWDYCNSEAGECQVPDVMEHLQKNAFNIITEVSTAAGVFKQEPWDEMNKEARGYALNQVSHSIAGLVTNLIGFNYAKIAAQ